MTCKNCAHVQEKGGIYGCFHPDSDQYKKIVEYDHKCPLFEKQEKQKGNK